ncbi:MAG: protein kinase [Myxococcota bacterium]
MPELREGSARAPEPVATSATLAACPKCGWLNLPAQACAQCGASVANAEPPDTRPVTGDELIDRAPIIDGRYRVLAKLGEGGMGAVYRVEHIRMGKIMALKVLRPDLAKKRSSVDRFHREGQMVSRLNHPNTITVFDSGVTDAGLLYLAMEYVPGRDLSEILAAEGPFEERQALAIVSQVLRSLGEAHEAGIIHRDMKPGNVMLTRTREDPFSVKVLDFGIAKLTEARDVERRDITGGADLVGTPSCMSPEQAKGKELDARSDIYSVTAMLFELLTGRGPFVGGPIQVVTLHLTQPPPKLREVCPDKVFSDSVEAIVAKGLAKEPSQRFQSADDMRRAIDRVLGDPLASISSEAELNLAKREDWDAFERSFRREYYGTRVAVILTVLLALLGGGWYWQQRQAALRNPSEQALREELEPNDVAVAANRIALDVPLLGTIGGQGKADQDMYVLSVGEAATLQATVSGVPGLNLELEVFQTTDDGSSAAPLAETDDAPVGGAETISDLPVRAGSYLFRLRDRRRLDEPEGPPRENLEARYTFSVRAAPPRAFEEIEPNNTPAQAMVVALNRPVLGRGGVASLETVARAGQAPPPAWSIDNYRLDGLDGRETICAILGGAPGATLRLTGYHPSDAGTLRPIRSVQVRERKTGAICTRGDSTIIFEVRVDVGDTKDALYPIAFISTQTGGMTGLLQLARALPSLDRADDARRMLRRALGVLPRADDAAQLRDALLRTPVTEGVAVEEEPIPTSTSGEALSRPAVHGISRP